MLTEATSRDVQDSVSRRVMSTIGSPQPRSRVGNAFSPSLDIRYGVVSKAVPSAVFYGSDCRSISEFDGSSIITTSVYHG
mgnify:CR=1 FL=1